MRQVITFDAFGRNYRVTQFAAIPALRIMDKRDELAPIDVLAGTEACDYEDVWHPLSDAGNINAYVTDAALVLPPRAILAAIVIKANEVNFGFLKTWKGTKVPSRFRTDAASISSDHIDPIVQTLTQEDRATYRELEEYYSLEDAFKMFETVVVESVNSALAHEQAERDAKTKRK